MIKNEFLSFHISKIKCIKFDKNSNRIATCGDDGKIDIFSLSNLQKPLATILKNFNKLNDLSWSKFQNISYLSSCGEDENKIIIFKEKKENLFKIIYEYKHKFPVIKCEFSPFYYGLILLCGDESGEISLHQFKTDINNFVSHKFDSEHSNINSLSWGPALKPINFNINYNNDVIESLNSYQFCSCGNDGSVKIWKSLNSDINGFVSEEIYNENNNNNNNEINNEINNNNNEIYAVKWLNYDGYCDNVIVFGGENKKLMFYKENNKKWEKVFEIEMEDCISNIEMSIKGGYLIVTLLNNNVVILEENLGFEWIIIKK